MDPNNGEQPPAPEPTLPSAEQMRARRLAKLGATTSSTDSKPSADQKTSANGGASQNASKPPSATSTAPPSRTSILAQNAAGQPSSQTPTARTASASATSGGAGAGEEQETHKTAAATVAAIPASSTTVLRPEGNASKSGFAAASAAAAASSLCSSPSSAKRSLGDADPAAASSANAPTDPPARRTTTTATGSDAGNSTTASPAAAAPAAPIPPPAPVNPAELRARVTDETIASVLRISMDPVRTKDRQGHPLRFLPELRKSLLQDAGLDDQPEEERPEEKPEERQQQQQQEGEPQPEPKRQTSTPRLTVDEIDAAIYEVCGHYDLKRSVLDYLLPCYKTATRRLKGKTSVPEREALQEIKRLCLSDMLFALTNYDFFNRESESASDPKPVRDSIVPYLLREPGAPLALDMDFMVDAVARFDDPGSGEEGQVQGIFTGAMLEISESLAKKSINDGSCKPYVDAMLLYTRFKPLVVALANDPSFYKKSVAALGIESDTLLGPFFRLSPLQPEARSFYFSGNDQARAGGRSSAQSELRNHQDILHTIAMAFARAGDGPRNRLLDWFAYAMNVNHKRRALQVNAKEVASDGFMMNLTAVLDRICEPFMEATFARMERIDVDYLRRHPRVDIHDETKLDADQAEADAYYAQPAAGESKFISEVFFLAMAAHHYGSGGVVQKYKDMDRQIKQMEDQLARFKEESNKLLAAGANSPLALRAAAVVKQLTADIERHIVHKHALEAVLLDEQMQQRALMFMRYVSVWLLRVASGSDYTPGKALQLPLPAEKPPAFRCLPEYVLQNVVEHFKFLFRQVPRILPSAVGDEMVALCITFLESSEYIRNPYLKSSLVSLLFSGTWRMYHLMNGVLGDALSNSQFANRYLLHALMKFYIECESTGMHTQFYDKFNIRYEIFQVIKAVWPNDLYKRQLTQQSRTNRPFFVQFVNLLLNDATYVLDEALSRFPKIHDLQKQLQDGGGTLSAEERQQRETELQQAEGQAQSYMQLANETVAMMSLFTQALSDAFTMPEIVTRLAGMLDYNLVTLAGPASRNLKVANPEKYFFNPKVLLPQIVELYLNLGSQARFVEAVASDGRSYKPDIFANATRILATKGLMDPSSLRAWDSLRGRFAQAKALVDQAETDLGEIPAEFEDPIMGDLMVDPVILPSRHIVDRSTIAQHLLSDPKDPFTRQPMTADDVVPATELQAQIAEWKAGRLAAAKAKSTAAIAAATDAAAAAAAESADAKEASTASSVADTANASTDAVPPGFEDDPMDTAE
ncbi:ubiquitin fusion degradation protein [Niveomyces insectorum RCEF 264]|uniref:Ubiquitin fusion degradation protein n=1 Tax=Niveomyces insectorum RCEF 264 TaxID=1081102 RepID=A0A162MGM2_9HYPO|nr:ubiquitin fusion degradation protein [Niveomyces insectorum RCEF 264]